MSDTREELEDRAAWTEIAEWDWLLLDGGDDDLFHAALEMHGDFGAEWGGDGTTECGKRGDLRIPGLFTRMSESVLRCPECCAATGMPQGAQSPKNIDACRPICEARIAARPASPDTPETGDTT